jgi:hypothetical protein
MSDNQCVIDILREISTMSLSAVNETWILNLGWPRAVYQEAQSYLLRFAKKLENLNKDALIYVDNVVGIEATKEAAKKYHFNNPFVKKSGIWKPNEKVLSILANGDIKFYAKAFTSPSSFNTKLTNQEFFMQLPAAGGAQRGGARKTPAIKATQALAATTPVKREKYYTERVAEFTQSDDVNLPAEYRAKLAVIRTRADRAKTKRDTPTVATPITSIKDWDIFSASTDGGAPLTPKPNVLYLFVRDFFPEVFTYAAMMTQAFRDLETDATAAIVQARYRTMYNAFPDVSIDLKTQYPLEYTFNGRGEMNIEGSEAGTPAHTLRATKEALYLAHKFITFYDYMPSEDLLAFVNYCVGNTNIFTADELASFNTSLSAIEDANYLFIEGQEGGGDVLFDPILSSAMDNHELYYSVYVQASYEDRTVSDAEFQTALVKNKAMMKFLGMKSAQEKVKSPGISAQTLRNLRLRTGMSPEEIATNRPLYEGRMYGIAGGKRKTQKKRRSSKQNRKTRRKK